MNKRIVIFSLIVILILVYTKTYKSIIPTKFFIDQAGDSFVLVDSLGNIKASDQVKVDSTNKDKIIFSNNVDVLKNAAVLNNLSGKSVSGDGTVPSGVVVSFAGTVAPVGWAFCNGKKYNRLTGAVEPDSATVGGNIVQTPDLRGRFVLGLNPTDAKNPGTDANTINGVGGAETHTLTEAQMPKHRHQYALFISFNDDDSWTETAAYSNGAKGYANVPKSDRGKHTNGRYYPDTSIEGNNEPHNNMPPFYVLSYIMKL